MILMNKSYTIELDTKELEKLQKKLDNWANSLNKAAENIVDDLANIGLDEMMKIYREAQQQYQDSTPMDFSITGNKNEKTVAMTGQQAIYDEFGTGTIGEQSDHPPKEGYGLNPYNSGKTIRKNKGNNTRASQNGIPVGGLYWTYKNNGEKIYTQGIPAQKEGHDSFKKVIKEAPSVIKKRIEEVIK